MPPDGIGGTATLTVLRVVCFSVQIGGIGDSGFHSILATDSYSFNQLIANIIILTFIVFQCVYYTVSYVCHIKFNHCMSVYSGTHGIMLGVPFFSIPTCTLDTLFPFYGHLSALAGGTGGREGECARLMSGEMGVSRRENLCSCILSRQISYNF